MTILQRKGRKKEEGKRAHLQSQASSFYTNVYMRVCVNTRKGRRRSCRRNSRKWKKYHLILTAEIGIKGYKRKAYKHRVALVWLYNSPSDSFRRLVASHR